MNSRHSSVFLCGFFGLLFFALFLLSACNQDDDDGETGDDDSGDDDLADDDTASDDDVTDDDSAADDILYAAAGAAVITPNSTNHPETIYLGGLFPSRIGTGVHDDLEASALALKQGDRAVVLVSLDLLGFSRSRIREIQERVAQHGIPQEYVLISSTHTHEAPDTLGVFGPNVLVSGVSPEYMAFVQDTIVELIVDVWARLTPVTMKAAIVTVNDPLSNFPTLMADLRDPLLTVDWISAAQFVDENGATVATLVNWHAHPEVMIQDTLVSSDFAGYLRQRVRDTLGGECVYISGAVGGLATPTGVDVPARDEDGNPVVDENDDPVYLQDPSWDKTRSLGFVIADLATAALATAETVTGPVLEVKVEQLLLPVRSATFILGFLVGIIESDKQDLITDQPAYCGWFGCSDDRIGMLRLGPLGLITSPGETFPETMVGRPASQVDYGEPWGVFDFPAIEGIQSSLDVPVPMLMSECGNEVAYLIPESDFHSRNHPDYYEEDLCFGRDTETIYREAAIDLLTSHR